MFFVIIPLPAKTDLHVRASGSAVRLVRCVHCGQEYVYIARREFRATGVASGREDMPEVESRVTNRARSNLDRVLDRAVDPVPCPGCYLYQPHMIEVDRVTRAGHQRRQGMITALVLLILGLIVVVWAPFFGSGVWSILGLISLIASVAALAISFIRAHRTGTKYDPNQRREVDRATHADSRAVRRAVFETVQQEYVGKQFTALVSSLKPREWHDPNPEYEFEVWVSADQIPRGETIMVPLPNGNFEPWELGPDNRNFEVKKIYRAVGDHMMLFNCRLVVYPQFDDSTAPAPHL